MKLKIMGTGSPEAMPVLTCKCKFCKGKIIRTRPSLAIQDDSSTIIVDASPDLREQFIKNDISNIDAVFLTHFHYDHFWGIMELEQLNWVNLNNFKLFLNKETDNYLLDKFPFTKFNKSIFDSYNLISFKDFKITPVFIEHSDYLKEDGLIIEKDGKKIAYIPDIKSIPKESLDILKDIDILIADGQYILGKYIEDNDHSGGKELIDILNSINAKRVYLIGYSEHWYKKTSKEAKKDLPDNFYIPNDGDIIQI